MNNTIFRKKLFIKELTTLAKQMNKALKNASSEEKEKHEALLKDYRSIIKIAKKGIADLKGVLPPIGDLDALFEIIIETSKLSETKPTIENRQSYQIALEEFMGAYVSSSEEDKVLWKAAFDESKLEAENLFTKLENALEVKERVDNFEETERAKIYCIIKGKNSDGSEWGRIDFVGSNYVIKLKDKVSKGASSNKLPLVVKYYSYQDKTYTHLKDSNQLESTFDKQLMDVFLKSGCTSYEIHKNLGRDYEYHPKNAEIVGKGEWYVNWAKPMTTERTAKIIEVPDWNDFHFEDLFNEYLDDCGKGILTNTAGDILKEKMREALGKQVHLIHELEVFHHTQNDGDKDTQILIDVWKKRKGDFEESMKELKRDCVAPYDPPEPCEDFEPIYDEHVAKCAANALPKRIGDQLKMQMQECIDNSRTSLTEMETALIKFKSIPNWEADDEIRQKAEALQEQIDERAREIEQQEKDLAALPEECLQPIPLEIVFDGGNNTVSSKDDKQLKDIAQFLINYPTTNIKLIGNTSISKSTDIDEEFKRRNAVRETVETDHIMPDDVLPKDLAETEVDSIRNRLLTSRDLMMIRAERVKQLLLDLGVNKSQIKAISGENLGLPQSNQKVVLEFY